MAVSSTTNAMAGGTATINATYSPQPTGAQTNPVIQTTILGGSADAATSPNGTTCGTINAGGTAVCSIHNGGTAGTDSVRVYADNNTNNQWDAGEPFADTSVTFSGAPAHITLTSPGATSATDTCAQYTAHVTDSNGSPAAGQPVVVTVTETATATPGATPITYYTGGCSGASSTATNNVAGNNITFTHNATVPTDNSGNVVFGLSSSAPGTATVKVANAGGTVSDQSNVTYSAGGANNVATVAVTSATTVTNYTGTTASYTVKATDAGGNPIQGVTVNKETTAGPDTVAPTACGATSAAGTVTCSITNGGTAGTDQLTFWVDNTAAGTHTSGPDANEPKATATAVFQTQPTVSGANSSLTCVQQLSGANHGTAQTSCTVPTSQHSVTFTAKVADSTGKAIQGAVVNFSTTSATLGGAAVTGSNLPAGTGTTDSNGVATFTVNDPSAAAGDTATVHATVGATSIGTATANWAAAHATGLTLTPPLQSVTKGGTVTVKAQVTDQFGNPASGTPNITYTVAGRNNGKTGTAAADGTISYTDAGVNAASNTDTITVVDNTDAFTKTATVDYVTGSASASTVTVDTSGNATTDATCAATGNTAATNVALGHTTEVCALVKNATGEVLAGKTVTFTVSNGQVAGHGALTTTSGTTYQATTDAAGVAFADVTSTKSGAQTVTAAADSATGSGTVTYAAPAATAAYSVAVTPATVNVVPGGQQKFTATVTDKFGNPVSGVSVTFTQSGPGTLGGASSNSVTTGADGTASVTLSTAATDKGSGSVTATIATTGTACASAPTGTPASTCSGTATYTVGASTTAPSALTMSAPRKVKVGEKILVTLTATNPDDSPAADQVVRVYLKGANTAAGSGTTDASGVAHVSFLATHHGTDHLAAFVDTNNDQIRTADEPRAFTTVRVQGFEHPSIHLTSKHGRVTVHVSTHPKAFQANVRYYVRRHGHWSLLGHNRTGGVSGKAHKRFHENPGSHHRFRVKVSATSTTTKGTSPARGIDVK
ncbi:MAG TPA: Ig-like domain-containing protein [Mycobacteriales bacterium]|nr:Ig-like domain-containing protein [Mycobacteriales bacterium]